MNTPLNTRQSLFAHATDLLRSALIMPMVTVDTAEQGARVASAFAEGGLNAVEITLRSPAALDAITAAKREVPGMLIGAGTIRTAADARNAIEAGADFLVSPGATPALAECLIALPVPCIPGVSTVSEMLRLAAFGFESMKLFPAVALGGVEFLREVSGPLPDIHFFAVGGIDDDNAAEFLSAPNVICVGGSWMFQQNWIVDKKFDLITVECLRLRHIIERAAVE